MATNISRKRRPRLSLNLLLSFLLITQAAMATQVSKATCQVQRKLFPADMEEHELDFINNSSKRRKKVSASAKVGYGVDEQQKPCHQCHQNQGGRMIECKKCRSKLFCVNCLTKWYPDVSEEEFVEACPVCRRNCNCKACLRGLSPKGYSCSKHDKIQYSKHILRKVSPLVGRLSEDQLMEKEIEAKVKGLPLSELQLEDAECDVDEDIYCDNCGAYFFDLYRSCACGYDLCLVCCRDLRVEGGKGMTCGWKSCEDGSIPCPPKEIGGCNDGILELKRIMPVDWVVNMLEKAQGIYKINTSDDIPETFTKCCMCCDSGNEALPPGDDGKLQKDYINANNLYSSSAKDIKPGDMQHFQLHWSKGKPIIVSDVLSSSSELSWEPMVLCRAFHASEVDAINCLDWSKVTIDLYKFFKGYSEGLQQWEGQPMILKLEDWQPSCLSEGEWPRIFVEFIGCLPFKDYTHPKNGYLNVAVKLPDLSLKPDMGPRMDIAYGVEEEWEYGNSVTKLHYDKSDTVNVMTHTKSDLLTSTKLKNTKMVKQKYGDQVETLACEEDDQSVVHTVQEGALWDIFQRQDTPKLENYLMNHSTEIWHGDCLSAEQIVHPIHDRIFYLNMEHKQKLKEEFGIEPWTFKQKLGDAVFIPAGCPYQSCTKVELNFVSPESLDECIHLQHELRRLPINHIAKRDNLNIGKMMLYALESAVMDLAGVGDLNGPIDCLHFAKTLNDYDANIYNHANGWLDETESNDNFQENSSKEDLKTKLVTIISSDSSTISRSSSSLDIATHEDCITKMSDKKTSKDPHELVGLWRGNAVGLEAKELLEAVEHRYPDTFQGVKIRAKSVLLSILKEFHLAMKAFVETSVDALTEEQITSFQQDLNEFEKFGFDISWARKRLDMVEMLKFGNEPLQQELMALEESLKPLKERFVEGLDMLMKARLEYKNATHARNRKAEEVAQKFGAEYDKVLKGHLGLGMLPGY